jgi:tetratricopeptide (TPR) repeat protein
MEASPAEPSESIDDGSIEAVTRRLLLWCKRTPPALAQVEFVDDNARRQVVDRLRAELGTAEVHFEEISLPIETPDRYVPDYLVNRLHAISAGVVSVDGFAAAFPSDRSKLADSIYRLSVKRELLASPSHRQIWWVPIYLAELLEQRAPDLESWIQLKLRLTVAGSAVDHLTVQLQPEASAVDLSFTVDPAQARLQAQDAFRRFQRAVAQGMPPGDGITSLMRPAIDLLRRAKLDEEARELQRQSLDLAFPTIDVFISYTVSDSNWAKWLDFILRKAGYTTTVQLYDFPIGESFVHEIHEALKKSRYVVCLLSPAYLASRWCGEEWQSSLRKGNLFPLRIAKCEPDGLLGPRAYLDLVGVPEASAKEQILAEIEKREGSASRPQEKPAFPGAGLSSTHARFPGGLPPIWNISAERNPYFTGREQILSQLHEVLTAGNTAALTQTLSGLGGVGKTQLALEYAYRHVGDYEGVWWLRAEEPVTLASDYAALAPQLGVAVVADQGLVIREVRERLSQREHILLIFDNATAPGTLKPYLPLGPGRRVLVTTRVQAWPGANPQDVHELPLESAITFLLNRTGQTDRVAAENVAQRLGCLPLALEQAAAYVVECKKQLHDYASLLGSRGLAVLEKGQPYQSERSVGTTWALSFEKLEAKCPAAADLLHLCAFLAPEAIYVGELAGASKHLPEALAKALADELGLDEIKAALLAYSLIQTDGDTITIHRLVSDVIRKGMDPEAREQWLRAAVQSVNELFPFNSPDVRTWPTCSRWLPHALMVVNWDNADTKEPSACTRILNQTGLYLMSRADYGEAEPLFRRALAIDEQHLGPRHQTVAIRLNNLANLLQETNRLAEAEPLFRRALAIDEQRFGPKHPEVATDLNNLANLLQETNRLAEAEPLFRRALAIDEQHFGPKHPNVGRDINNLANLLQDTNRPSEAEPLFRRALEIDEQSLGPNHPKVAEHLNNLASLLHTTNRLSEAEPLFRRAVSIMESSLGPNHPKVAIVLNNLGLLVKATRMSDAEALFRRAVHIAESRLGPDHPSTRTFRKNLDGVLAKMGKGTR